MAKQVGLRTEIILHITLLLGAALLLGGFLMLKLTEQELLGQRISSLSATMEVVAAALARPLTSGADAGPAADRVMRLVESLPEAVAVGVWQLRNSDMIPLYIRSAEADWLSSGLQLQNLRYLGEPQNQLAYAGAWPSRPRTGERFFKVTVPVHEQGVFSGVVQARFSLEDVAARTRSSLKILVFYVALYGTVLFLFGLYLIGRNVVRPIGVLMASTQNVAAGDLDQQVVEEGPKEIASLARSFNLMMEALRNSRRQTAEHIHSVEKANEELRRARKELLHSEKMASVGHLAAGLAHEVGNPLAAVIGYLELLKAELPAGRQREIAEHAAGEAGRIDGLVRELLDYAKPGNDKMEPFDPLTVVREALSLLEHQGVLADNMLVDHLPAHLPSVTMVPQRLLQVFINLLVNARDASSAEGKIRLAAGLSPREVWLSVADQGAGIAEADLPHIFDPFFTTKAPGRGRGLGLAFCQRVIDDAGGTLEVRSAAGRGSTFTVRLPRGDAGNGD